MSMTLVQLILNKELIVISDTKHPADQTFNLLVKTSYQIWMCEKGTSF